MRSSNQNRQVAAAARHAVAELEQLESRKLQAANHEVGINVNDNSDGSTERALPALKALGVTSVRLWYSVRDWQSEKISGGLLRAIEYHDAGYDVTLTIAIGDKQVPSTGDVHDWFSWAANDKALKKAVDRWEIGNEVDSPNYFKGSLKQYVSNFLKPASDELHDAGEKVISAGFSWNPQDVKEIIGYGALDMVDYVGFHPYGKGVRLQKQRIEELQDIVGDRKPLVATEWNVRGYENDKPAWAASIDDSYRQVHAGFDLDYYYCLFTADTMAGPAGLIKKTGQVNAQFYNAFLKASQGLATNPTLPGTTPPNDGNTPSSSGDIKIALYNAKTDRVISGYENLKADQVIDLASLPTRDVAIVIVPKKAESVKMTLNGKTKIDSSGPYAYFGETGGNFKGTNLSVGGYALKVTPYKKDNAKGTAYASRTLNFTVKDSAKTPTDPTTPTTPTTPNQPTDGPDPDKNAEVTSYTLVDSKTGKAIKGYEHITKSQTISLASLSTRSLALLANVDEDAQSLKLSVNGKNHVENNVPYSFFYDNHGKLGTWTAKRGMYDFSAVAYAGKNAKSGQGSTMALSIKFV